MLVLDAFKFWLSDSHSFISMSNTYGLNLGSHVLGQTFHKLLDIEGDQKMPPENTELRHKDCLELKAISSLPPTLCIKAGHKFSL